MRNDCLDGAVRAQRRWAHSRSGWMGFWITKLTRFLRLESVGTSDDDVLIGGVYCIVGAVQPRLYRVWSRGVEGHGWRASAVGYFGKRCAVHVAIWQATMIFDKQHATRLRNCGVGSCIAAFWVSGHGCLLSG